MEPRRRDCLLFNYLLFSTLRGMKNVRRCGSREKPSYLSCWFGLSFILSLKSSLSGQASRQFRKKTSCVTTSKRFPKLFTLKKAEKIKILHSKEAPDSFFTYSIKETSFWIQHRQRHLQLPASLFCPAALQKIKCSSIFIQTRCSAALFFAETRSWRDGRREGAREREGRRGWLLI